MRVLLTGAAGFIGSTIADLLVEQGHDLVALDLLLPTAHQDVPEWAPPGLHRVDLCDENRVVELLAGVDVVCHQAAMVGLGVDATDAPLYAANNTLATATLLSAMARRGITRLVQASSMVVYGPGRQRCAQHGEEPVAPRTAEDLAAGRYEPRCSRCGEATEWVRLDESVTPDPRNAYAATKLSQEHLAIGWCEQTGGGVISLRYHNVYGPRMPRDTPYAGVASIFRSRLADGLAPLVFEDGGQTRDFVHVRDIARANLRALEAVRQDDPRGHRAYNVASGTPRTIGELATELSRVTGGPAPQVVGGGRPGDVRHVVADPSRIVRELGFVAQEDFGAGLAELATPQRETALSQPAG